ncbi:MAG TPA: NAD(P)/FAD-dependent oxidoreductase [Gemmatimonadaceae bacterium]|nr:NAD(P)/FAD-dependent oxidoreductase [Gemmatimonadaceae bacterium]
MTDTLVIGAGAAGLFAARELMRAGREVVVLEANHRVGGRILTELETRAGIPIELGAEFVHGEAPETTRLLDEARLATVPVLGRHYRSDHGELCAQGPAWERMQRVFAHLSKRRKEDRSFQEFLDDEPGGARLRAERELARGFVQGFNGADPALVSEKSLAEQDDPTEGAAEARRIVNGYAALVVHLEREVAGLIRLHTAARRVVWNDDGVVVVDARGEEHRARTAVVTVPLPMLQDGAIRIEPEVPALRRAAGRLVMGHVVRVNVVVRERFWDEKVEDLGYLHAPTRPITVWWTQNPVRAPLLTGWAGGPPALELSRDGRVEETVVAELAHAFGMRRARMEAEVESLHWHDWSRDEHVRGAYSYVGVGGTSAPRSLARAVGGRLFIAGEATDSESGGTVEGALASATRTVRGVLRALSD